VAELDPVFQDIAAERLAAAAAAASELRIAA
jgi:hypothetical protein